jgi:amino acid adenylation domain-containing protein
MKDLLVNPTISESTEVSSRLTPAEKHQILVEFNATKVPYPHDKTVIDLFEEQARLMPHAMAVVFEEQQLTYKELNEYSNQLAHYLRRKGVKEETLVPICIERSLQMIIGILGILKSGGAYVPIDSEYPEERISYILEDTRATIAISSNETKSKLQNQEGLDIIELDATLSVINQQPTTNVQVPVATNNLVYVIYTSGSTGKPKGVMIEHRGLLNLSLAQAGGFGLKPGMKTLQFAAFGFDASCSEIFTALLSGGCLVLPQKKDLLSIEEFEKLINKHKVKVATLPPSYQNVVKDALRTLKTVISAGEPLNVSLGRYLQSKGIRVMNAYGPTENTVCVSMSDDPIKENNVTVIGKPISNVQVYILDNTGDLCPVGATGEICVGGVQVARGYLHRPDLTAEKFIVNPFSKEAGARMYKTGDLGKWRADGNIEFLGRIDDQVKIRGYRIELGEIESVLNQCELVGQAVVLAREDKEGNKRLIAYIIPKRSFDRKAIINYLMSKLPEYMVPTILVEVENFPITPNGKIDKKALPDPDRNDLSNNEYVAPRDKTEQQLAEIWQKLLHTEKVGIHDNFFEIGGNSLIATRLMSKIEKAFNLKFPISLLFKAPTIEELSYYVSSKINLQESVAIPIQPNGSQLPFFVVGDLMRSLRYYKLSKYLGEDYPVYEFKLPTKDVRLNVPSQEDIEKTASFFVKEMLRIQPEGPYFLGGTCGRGIVAYEMAQQLHAMGHKIGLLALFEVYTPEGVQIIPSYNFWKKKAGSFKEKVRSSASYKDKSKVLFKRLGIVFNMFYKITAKSIDGIAYKSSLKRAYIFKPYPDKITLFKSEKEYAVNFSKNDPYLGWRNYCPEENIELVKVPGGHGKILQEPGAKVVAEYIKSYYKKMQSFQEEAKKIYA